MKKAVLILAPDLVPGLTPNDAIGRLSRALAQSEWTVHTASDMRDIPRRIAQQVTAILAPVEQYSEVAALARAIGAKAKIVATVPFSDPFGEDKATGAGAFSVLHRPFAINEVLEVLGFASAPLALAS